AVRSGERLRLGGWLFEIAARIRSGYRGTSSRCPALETVSAFTGGSVRARFEELHVVQDDSQLGLLLTVLTRPLIELKMTFNVDLSPLAKILFNQVGQLPALPAIKALNVQKNRFGVPFPGRSILLSVIHRKSEIRYLATVRKGSHLRIACQSPDQHHFVQVRHDASLLRK